MTEIDSAAQPGQEESARRLLKRAGRVGRIARVFRFALLSIVDSFLWAVALAVAVYARFGFDWSQVNVGGLVIVALVAIDVHLIVGGFVGLYTGRRRLASFEETGWVAVASLSGAVAALAVAELPAGGNLVPLSAILAAGAYQVIGALAARYLGRTLLEWRFPHRANRRRLLVFGAGEAGYQTVRALQRDSEADTVAVALLDDDPMKAHLRMQRLRVVGGRNDIAAAAERFGADVLLIAMPSVSHEVIVDVADRAQVAGLTVQVLPRLSQIVEHGVRVRDIRDITLADFLSRPEVHLDLDQIAAYLHGKRILVTGAGGSIGSQLCETIRTFGPERVFMLDHSENNLHRLCLRLDGTAAGDSPDVLLADIRDREALREIFDRLRPQVVFHAAAHKHVPFLELHPAEGVKTNVFGTLNVLGVAAEFGVERFVNISTDKAADPVNVLGLTKRIAERVTAHVATQTPGVFLSVRFGNVLGSDGSVIPTFREQLAQGRAMTVTHEDVTRYFMTIPEAVHLVLQAGAIGCDGDVLVLEMGEPVKIVDLARRLAAELKPGVPPWITFTGLRPGEKLHEVLFSANDTTVDKPHEALWRCRVPPLDPGELDGAGSVAGMSDLLERTRQLQVDRIG